MNDNFNNGVNNGGNNPVGQNNYYNAPQGKPYTFLDEFYLRENEKRKDKKVIKTVGMLTAGAIIFYLVFAVLFSVLLLFLMKKIPSLDFLLKDFVSMSGISIFESVVLLFLPFIICYGIMRKKKFVGIMPLGTFYNRKAAAFLDMAMLPIVLVTTIAINYISAIIQAMAGITFESGFEDMTINGPWEIIFSIISLAIVPAIIEEIAVRGVILQPLRRYGDMFAIVISALIFALMHGNMVQTPYTFIGGIYFGFVAVATGSIWASIILHMANNMFSIIVTVITSTYGFNIGAYTALGMLVAIIIAGIIGGVLFKKMNYKVKLQKGVDTLKLEEKISAFFLNPPMIIALCFIAYSLYSSVSNNYG